MENTLYFGDNLPIIREFIKDNSIDLIYLDPPFNSKANYNVIFKAPKGEESAAQITAFEDTWHWHTGDTEFEFNQLIKGGGVIAEVMKGLELVVGKNDLLAYLTMMAIRLRELYRVLKDTGSLYLHCDPTASHYLKIILDAIFEAKNFRNEIIWHYRRWTAPSNKFQKLHDVLLFYSKTKNPVFNIQLIPYTAGSIARKKGGKLHRFKKGEKPVLVSNKEIQKKGVPENDVWQIPFIAPSAKERLGYPTQKPLALLDKIIKASSNEGDVILDPFCGCGTAIVAAQKLKRNWIGIDVTHLAIHLMEERMKKEFAIKPKVIGSPASFSGAENLFKRNPLDFERWAVTRIDGIHPNKKQVGDGGVDGRGYIGPNGEHKVIVSVKGGKTLTPSMVAQLIGVMEKEHANFGILITIHKPTDGMLKEAISQGFIDVGLHHFPKIQIWTISDFFNGKKPDLP